ncbi:MAG: lipopolysaccharide assembly protein LapA domain-containing protein [Brevinema sp.]
MRIFIALVSFFIFLIFAIQNNNLVNVSFFTFHVAQIPLFSVIITVFILGVIVGYTTHWIKSVFSSKKSVIKKK